MLSSAIHAVRDGAAGLWQPDLISATPNTRPVSDITYLRGPMRGVLLDHDLFTSVRVPYTSRPDRPPTVEVGRVGGGTLIKVPNPMSQTNLDALFDEQASHVRRYADLRQDRIGEINLQIDDLLSFFGALAYLDDRRRQKTLELLQAAVRFAIHVEMMVKHQIYTPRPVEISPQIYPVIQTPDHSAFPSGHACEAFLVAALLDRLMSYRTTVMLPDGTLGRLKVGTTVGLEGEQTATFEGGTNIRLPDGQLLEKEIGFKVTLSDGSEVFLADGRTPRVGIANGAQPYRVAHRIAVNRTIAGVHYPMDSAAGALLGIALAEHIWSLARSKQPATTARFNFVFVDHTIPDAPAPDPANGEFAYTDDFTLNWLQHALREADGSNDAGANDTEFQILKEAVQIAIDEW